MIGDSLSLSLDIFSKIDGEMIGDNLRDQKLFIGVLSFNKQSSELCSCELTRKNMKITNRFGEIFVVEMNQKMKFEVIFEDEKDIKSRKIGFCLRKEKVCSKQNFFCFDSSQLFSWIQNLNKVIHQFGFHEQYKAIRKLGKGQFANVFEVEQLLTGKRFAVKAFSKGVLIKTPKGMETLANEIKILRSFSHENLQKIECIFESENSIYIVTQLLKGGTLFERIEKVYKSRGALEYEQIRDFLSGIFSGLNVLNQKRIVHRDLKLENIMFRKMDSFEPVIIDFGLAAFVDDVQYLYYRCGTPGYVSPQVMNSTKNQKVEPISDLFSIGSIFHLLLTSRPLFGGEKAQQVFKKNKGFQIDISSSLYDGLEVDALNLLKGLLQLDPKMRISPNEGLMSEYLSCPLKSDSPKTTVAYETVKELGQYLDF